MSRIGILTFTKTLNYGALLQAFALQEAIASMGHSAVLLNYNCAAITRRETPHLFRLKDLRHPRSVLYNTLSYRYKKQRLKSFEAFERECCNLSNTSSRIADLAAGLDGVVVGSDQVWNPVCTGGDDTYYLMDSDFSSIRKVSYAASFGEHRIPEERRKRIGSAISGFHAVSVREESGKREVYELCGRNAEVVLDPTLLLSASTWRKFCCEIPEKYVFAYLAAEVGSVLEAARHEAIMRELPLVVVKCYRPTGPRGKDVRYENNATPERFLSLIDNAESVFTSSFHGFCFSVLFNKQVWYGLMDGVGSSESRIGNLASSLGIQDRNVSEYGHGQQIDFGTVNEALESERARSLGFLRHALA